MLVMLQVPLSFPSNSWGTNHLYGSAVISSTVISFGFVEPKSFKRYPTGLQSCNSPTDTQNRTRQEIKVTWYNRLIADFGAAY